MEPDVAPYDFGTATQIPPPNAQASVIQQVQEAAARGDPRAQQYMARFGRSMPAVFGNRATMHMGGDASQGQGLSDWLMTHSPGAQPGRFVGRYSPEQMDFSKRLTQGVMPGEYHGAEMAGTATNLATGAIPMAAIGRSAGVLRGPNPNTPGPTGGNFPGGNPLPQLGAFLRRMMPGSSPTPPPGPEGPFGPAAPPPEGGPFGPNVGGPPGPSNNPVVPGRPPARYEQNRGPTRGNPKTNKGSFRKGFKKHRDE